MSTKNGDIYLVLHQINLTIFRNIKYKQGLCVSGTSYVERIES